MDQIQAVAVDVVAPEAGRGQGIDWTRSLTFATGNFSLHFEFEERNLTDPTFQNPETSILDTQIDGPFFRVGARPSRFSV